MEQHKGRQQSRGPDWPRTETIRTAIELHVLPPVAAINGTRIRELTGDNTFADAVQVLLRTFCAKIGKRMFHVGFCLGNETGFSAIGIAVIERLRLEARGAPVHVVQVAHEDIAWDIVLRHLRTFTGRILLFAFPNSDVYDAGTAETVYSEEIRLFDEEGVQIKRLTPAQRHKIREQKAAMLNRPPPAFYPATDVAQADTPWIFRFAAPVGKVIRTLYGMGAATTPMSSRKTFCDRPASL